MGNELINVLIVDDEKTQQEEAEKERTRLQKENGNQEWKKCT